MGKNRISDDYFYGHITRHVCPVAGGLLTIDSIIHDSALSYRS
jgi:hypothetical protein